MTYTSSAQNVSAPEQEERKDLARDLGLTFEKVSRWFSRERSDAPRRLLADGTKLQAMKRPTLEQKSRLEAEYSLNPKPSVQRQKEIALDVGLSSIANGRMPHVDFFPTEQSPMVHGD
ncbi:hypothetical protein DFP72DRAFT_847272 [Ephemerocybe angulata]|uniref:Homeobox domain-containing protein n=1 Tax=Ephemerocybe angulata TaxID=980116 RepID=A0A8H6HYG1_9AGAR|nr:hypothetical protein DFP72DRAFT_847272 [Tulosesus angulatus]